MRSFFGTRRGRTAAAAVALFGVGGGIAFAAIPDSSGVYHACMLKNVGTIRIIDPDRQRCSTHLEVAITFAKEGPQGESGPAGPPGPPGADGVDGEDGEPFSGTFTSPNGLFSLRVTDTAIELSGPSSRIRLTGGGGVEIRSATGVDVVAGRAVVVQAGTAVGIEASGDATIEAGNVLSIRGSSIAVNPGAGCARAARLGDTVSGTTIVTGSPTVCIG